jgi:hypothetical protein
VQHAADSPEYLHLEQPALADIRGHRPDESAQPEEQTGIVIRKWPEQVNRGVGHTERRQVGPAPIERNVHITTLVGEFADQICELPFRAATLHRGDAVKNPHARNDLLGANRRGGDQTPSRRAPAPRRLSSTDIRTRLTTFGHEKTEMRKLLAATNRVGCLQP